MTPSQIATRMSPANYGQFHCPLWHWIELIEEASAKDDRIKPILAVANTIHSGHDGHPESPEDAATARHVAEMLAALDGATLRPWPWWEWLRRETPPPPAGYQLAMLTTYGPECPFPVPHVDAIDLYPPAIFAGN